MNTENEGNAVPQAPSAPPVPVDAPAVSADSRDAAAPGAGASGGAAPGGAASGAGEGAGSGAAAPGAGAGAGAGGAGVPGAEAWPPPQPPAMPSYGSGGGSGSGWGASYQPQEPKPGRRRGGLVAGVLAAALVAGGVGGGVGYWAAEQNDNDTGSTTVSAADTPADLKRDPGSVARIANDALPSVVTIEAQSGSGEGGTGTGFVYDKQGHILTNNHVVASAAEGGKLQATFSNGKKYAAEVIGRAEGYDVAVIKLKNRPDDLKPLPLGNSDRVAVGDSTIAIGAPFGLSNTVTTGIISAKNRPVTSSDGGQSGKSSYMSALQTDASINPGNSGGPLLDGRGAVIGINSAIKPADSGGLGGTGQSGSIGLGFAIPVNQAKNVAQQLIKTGQPVYPVIGASVSLQQEGANGATISQEGASGSEAVTPNGPADRAGLKPGDVITKLDGTVIDSGPTLIGQIWTHKPGDTVKITYERDGKEHTVDVTLGQRKGDS
ncbi:MULTISPECIES: S1C family serine protease [unclassified Streptomyces]|uniref:S1C family serine protease n=1 Tax=unclassified Streptomyces TaxID=2593676 RepID=UPI0007467142|nr:MULTISPECIES: trypsin-like peptidase domain-containing protein [unclassified Streptomyces]KUL61309.1 protease [Streptomyces sp. NRRL S-1521]THC47108.1 PDZ domain-containing protein [Streptomyces sp. A1499]